MPAGPTVGSLWDTHSARYVMLSRPFATSYGQTSEVPLQEPPADRSQLVVQILRDQPAPTVSEASVDVTLVQDAQEIQPVLVVGVIGHLYAIWYDLQPGRAEVRAGTNKSVLEPMVLDLQPGSIERRVGQLSPRPALDVELEMPKLLQAEETSLEVRRLPFGEVVASRKVTPGSWAERIEGLPRALLEVEFQSTAESISKTVDLSDGTDGFLHLEIDPVILTGQVLLGDEPHPARLTFSTSGNQSEVVAQADEGGRYELVSLRPLRSVEIEIRGLETAPFVEFFFHPITGPAERDFAVPDRRFTLRVIDAVSGRPIPNAMVVVRNLYDDNGDPSESNMAVVQQVKCDDEGIGNLPPLRAGELEAEAYADGYAQMQEPAKMKVAEEV